MKIIIINGPNLNMLGYRDKQNYGNLTYQELNKVLINHYGKIEFFQSNHEGSIIDKLQEIKINESDYQGIILNLGGYTHTSVAIADAVEMIDLIKVEVHLSNITKREEYRKRSYIENIVDKRFFGEKEKSYIKAIDYIRGE